MSGPTSEDMKALRYARREASRECSRAWSARHPYAAGGFLIAIGAVLAAAAGGHLADRKFTDAAFLAFLSAVTIAWGTFGVGEDLKARDKWTRPS